MPTPKLYASFASYIATLRTKMGWKSFTTLALLAFLPAILERVVPALGQVPGKILFVVMVTYFCLIAPYLAFQRHPKHVLSNKEKNRAMGKAIFCNIWIVFCVWAIYVGLFPQN